MKRRTIRMGATVLATAMLFAGEAAAQEKRLGEYIYVPAMQMQAQSGGISLRVEGLSLAQESDDPVITEQLAGAEFAVYVFSAEGTLVPWADPLNPGKPMKIRTGDGINAFSLPLGMEFYLLQESAPEGYSFEQDALIAVEGSEVVVTNAMKGQLVLSAKDSLGEPLVGVTFSVTGEDGAETTLVSDENGEAVLVCERPGLYEIAETALPQGELEAIGVSAGRNEDVIAQEGVTIQVDVREATRTRVSFEHPASGSVQLNMRLAVIGEDGETTYAPLSGVVMTLDDGQNLLSLTTDENGFAHMNLLEGVYTATFTYDGDATLPLSGGPVYVESGATRIIALDAHENVGRVALRALSGKAVEGGSVTLMADQTGKQFGPYTISASGLAVSDALEPGAYLLSIDAPQNTQLGQIVCAERAVDDVNEILVDVSAGGLTQASVQLITRETQTYALSVSELGEDGLQTQRALTEVDEVSLVNQDGEAVGTLRVHEGSVTIDALSGTYALQLPETVAQQLGVEARSVAFRLPDEKSTVDFTNNRARLVLGSVDENGMPIAGAVYELTDSAGECVRVTTDETGRAVSPLLAAGDVTIKNVQAPTGHDAAETATIPVAANKTLSVVLAHPSYGTASVMVGVQTLDEQGEALFSALENVSVRIMDAQMTATVAELTVDELGTARIQLEPGDYVALVSDEETKGSYRLGEEVRFSVENTQDTSVVLRCYDGFGGVCAQFVGGELTEDELKQVRFELTAADGTVMSMAQKDGAYYVGGVPQGAYTLKLTQMPEGYTLGSAQEVDVSGGEAVHVRVPLVEYALVTVEKTGLTFNDDMQTFVVPLSGAYGVYIKEDDKIKPYPSEEEQMVVWSHVTPEQIAQGMMAQAKLPADLEGTIYYLREIGGTEGFEADDTYHELMLFAGDQVALPCSVASERGFFSIEETDALTGEHVVGSTFEVLNAQTMEVLYTFEMGETAYRNARSLPVGEYVIRQKKAAPGYVLSETTQTRVRIAPYLTQNDVAQTQITSVPLPDDAHMVLLADIYAAQQQGLTLVSVESSALKMGETLILPQTTMMFNAPEGERLNIESVMLGGAMDANGCAYAARVEYCLSDGGWQPSDARMTQPLTEFTAVSLSDVEEDVCAIRVTYINAETGEEIAAEGFTPGGVTVDLRSDSEQTLDIHVQALFTGKYPYCQELDGPTLMMDRVSSVETTFEAQGTGAFNTVSPGRDGTISGVAFIDRNGDGVMGADEEMRYEGLLVSLTAPGGEVLETCRTDAQGRYAFGALSGGTYVVEFDMSELVYTYNDTYSIQTTSRVQDVRNGRSDALTLDGDRSDYVVNAGCMYAASVLGNVVDHTDDVSSGIGALSVEMRRADAGEDVEPVVVMTDETGAFAFGSMLPGEYEISLFVPGGYLCEDAQQGRVTQTVSLKQGEQLQLDPVEFVRAAVISGRVFIDEDGDGTVSDDAACLAGVKATLVRDVDGNGQVVGESTTDETGVYRFDGLAAGTYSVTFELPEDWAFARHGESSAVFGAAGESGSTRAFDVSAGEEKADVDACVTKPASLTVAVFKDNNDYDGEKGYYEEWLAGVNLTLIRLENGEEAQKIACVTGEDGRAKFETLSPGEYVLAYEMPGAWRTTKQIDPETTSYVVSAVAQNLETSGRSEPFTVNMQSEETMYIGAMLTASMSGTMYYDDDANAKRGEDEQGCAGMAVELLDAQDNVLRTATTDENGGYAFVGLAPGRYRVRFAAPQGCGFAATEYSMSRGGVQESDECIATTRLTSLDSGDSLKTADAGVVRLCSIGGVVWEDKQADCAVDEGEQALEGVTVALMNSTARNILATTTTDANGAYTFANLRPGAYLIRVSAPEGYVFSGVQAKGPLTLGDLREGRAYSEPFDLEGGTEMADASFGMYTQGSVSGTVWLDKDYDGVKESGEAGLRSVTLTLLDEAGEKVAQTSSKSTGEYAFSGLKPGMYTMRVSLGDGYAFTAGGADSSAAQTTEQSTAFSLGEVIMGEQRENVNVGALQTASVSGVVWHDQDADGRRQNGDQALSGVCVKLTAVGGTDEGKVLETTVDSDGSYRFDSVMPGEYRLSFVLPDGYAFTRQATGAARVSVVPQTDALSAQSDALTIASGDVVTDQDAGVVGVGTLSGRVWMDSAYDGHPAEDEPGVENAGVELINAVTGETLKVAVTDENGRYSLDFVRMGEYRMRVTLPDGHIFTMDGASAIANVDDSVGTSGTFALQMGESLENIDVGSISAVRVNGTLYMDANENGKRDDGEAGLVGAQISAMRRGEAIATVQTDAHGGYEFESLRQGSYSFRVNLPEDSLFVKNTPLRLVGENATTGETAVMETSMGQRYTVDAIGVVKTATISGVAWSDADADGMRGDAETPLIGTTVQLLAFREDGEAEIASTAQVDENGAYAFDLIRAGDYAVRFVLPEGMLFADRVEGENVSSVPVVPGHIGATEPMTISQGDVRSDVNVGGILPGEVGETVWKDSNGNGLQDYREPLLPGIEVCLLRVERDGSMQEAMRTISDNYGYYYFRSLRPGTYIVQVHLREGDTLTTHFGAPLGEIDSDLDPNTGMSDEIALRSGEVLRNVDIGFIELSE